MVIIDDKLEPHEELAELLNGEPAEDLNNPPVVEPVKEKGEPSEVIEAKADETKDEPVKQEEAPPASNDEARFQAMLAKSKDEVSKRQAAEFQNDQLRQQLEQAQRQPVEQIDPLDNPDGYRQQLEAQSQQQQINDQNARTRDRIAMSEMVVKTSVGADKYDPAIDAFADAARLNPALSNAMNQSDIPAQFAYDEGRRILFMAKIGNDPEAYETSIREQVRK